jgi:Carboxypeptidase regulatory-like domain
MRSLATYLSVVQCVLIELVVGLAVAPGQLPVGTISGLVADPTGAAIANAEIIVKEPGTGFERKLNTKANGTFRVDNLHSFISQTHSSPPLNTILNGPDLDGDGISRTLLPGTTQNSLGSGLSNFELRGLVAEYNADVESRTRVTTPDGSVAVIRPRTPFNQIILPITLPDKSSSGDSFLSQDLRLTRMIRIRDRAQLTLIGEVFNIFNIARLTGYSDVLNQPNYGQPSARAGQVFGAGGPRAFQFAVRFVF